MALANSYRRNSELAEDIAQDILLHTWRHLAEFEGRNGAAFKTWFYRIATNLLRSRARTKRLHIECVQLMPEHALTYTPDYDTPIRERQAREIIPTIRLPRQQRTVLHHILNNTYDSHVPGAKVARFRVVKTFQETFAPTRYGSIRPARTA